MNPKKALFIALAGALLLGAPTAMAHEDQTSLADHAELDAAAVKTSPISSLFRNLFRKNVEERRENLEKNKDIRNKLIEERIRENEINIKFNQKKEEIREQHTEQVILQFIVSVEKLENIKDRVESRIQKFEEKGADVTEAKDLTLLATAKLENAKLNLFEATATTSDFIVTTATTTPSSVRKELLNLVVDDLKVARELLVKAISSMSAQMDIETGATSTDPTPEEIEATNNENI